MKKKSCLWILAAVMVVAAVVFILSHSTRSKSSAIAKKKVVMVTPSSLNSFSKIKKGLRETCSKSNYKIRIFSAEGDASKFGTVVKNALRIKPDYFVAIGSQIVTEALGERNKSRMPQTIAGLISVPDSVPELVSIGINPPRNFSMNIVSHVPQSSYEKVVDLLLNVRPSVKKIGILYNVSELNSNNMRISLERCIREAGAQPLLEVVTTPEDVSKATKELLRLGADAIIIPHDKSATAKASTVAKLCNAQNVLTASLDEGIIKDGVMFAVSVSYVEIGKRIGEVILEAEASHVDLKDMPMITIDESDLRVYVNSKALSQQGIKVSEKIVNLPVVKR